MKPTLNDVGHTVYIDRADFADWLKQQGEKKFAPAGCDPGDCFISKYLMDNNVVHRYMWAFDQVVVTTFSEAYQLPKWAEMFARLCFEQSRSPDHTLPASRAVAILMDVE